MNLTELKTKSPAELQAMAQTMGLEDAVRAKKQDIIFEMLKAHARTGEDIFGF